MYGKERMKRCRFSLVGWYYVEDQIWLFRYPEGCISLCPSLYDFQLATDLDADYRCLLRLNMELKTGEKSMMWLDVE
ncbi:MAG: hypothetical protein ACLU4N_28675 [Butyricimonas faecihominis]